MAIVCEWTAAALEVRRGDIVQDQRAAGQMARRESVFDALLASVQPVHRGVEVILVDVVQFERFGQARGGRLGVQTARSGQLGLGVQNARRNQGGDELAFSAGMAIQHGLQAETPDGAQDSGDMAMRKRTGDLEGFRGGDEGFALQQAAQGVDLSRGPGGQVGEGAFDDLAVLADGLAQEDGRWGVAVGDGLDVHGPIVY